MTVCFIFIILSIRQNYMIAITLFFAMLPGLALPYLIGFGRMLAIIYGLQIHANSNFDSTCRPVTGQPIDGGRIQVCERRDWAHWGILGAVVKFTGNPQKLMNHEYSKARRQINDFGNILPFGINKYECLHIFGPYFILLFDSRPVLTTD